MFARSESRFLSGKERRFGVTKSQECLKLNYPHSRDLTRSALTSGCRLFDGSNARISALVRAFGLVVGSRLPGAVARQVLPANGASPRNLAAGRVIESDGSPLVLVHYIPIRKIPLP